jgi:predicted acetyltransferase
MALNVRPITDDEFGTWSDALDVGFQQPGNRDQGASRRQFAVEDIAAGRTLAGFDGDRAVGTFRHYGTPMSVPGGDLRVGAVTNVAVLPTHRRQGLLTRMMALGLSQSVEQGEAASILIPAEWPIYGRYGFGIASEEVKIGLDATRAALVAPLPGTVEHMDPEDFCKEIPAFYERMRALTPGTIPRREIGWRRYAGLITREGKPNLSQLFAVLRDDAGEIRAFAAYSIEDRPFVNFRAANLLKADDLVADSATSRMRLLQFLWEHDWVTEVEVKTQSVDDDYRYLLTDARTLWQAERNDVLWIRLLDVATALASRTYENPGRLVVKVEDRDGYAAGVYALDGGPDGATCSRSTENPDLVLPVQALGSIFLGGYAPSLLAEVGQITEETPGALRTADNMFHTHRAPQCLTWF